MLLFSCEETTGPEEEAQSETKKLLIYSDASSISANGGSANVLVKVYANNDTLNVVSGVKVNFSAAISGSKLVVLAQNEITDAKGYARAILYAGTRSGTASVTASLENYSDTVFITVAPGAGLVTASPSSILADGVSTSTISATVIDSLGQPLPGALVSFAATNGTITNQAYSDQSGIATAILTSSPSATDLTCTVTATTAVAKAAVAAKESAGEESAAKAAKADASVGTSTVTFRGITLSGTVDKTVVFANGADSTSVSVSVKETTTGAAVEGARLLFASALGTVRTTEVSTDSDGVAECIVFGGSVSGKGMLTATLAEGLQFTSELSFIKQLFMTVSGSPSELSANGSDLATIKAFLFDADNNPIKGETVYFSTSLGTIQSSAVTDDWGEASVSLKSARYNGVAQIIAAYQSLAKVTSVEFSGSDIQATADPLVLVADDESMSRLTVTLSDASGSAIVDETVTLETTLGTLVNAAKTESGTSVCDSTSTEGKITAYLRSDSAGTALIRISANGFADSLEIDFTDYTFSVIPENSTILAGGSDVTLTASLKDKNGALIAINADDVEFSSTLGTITVKTGNADGSVSATLVSGNNAGTATVMASIKDPAVSASTSVIFDAADVGSISVESSKNFVRIGENSISIIARVFDETGNPKSGETVTFSIIKGPGGGEHLETVTAVSNSVGIASVTFVSGMTGSVQNGVEIQAAIGTIKDTVNLTITGQPESVVVGFDTDNFQEKSDGTYGLTVSAIVSDVNRNKVVDGTIVNFSIVGDVGVIDPEVTTTDGVASTTLVYSPSDAGTIINIIASSGGKQDTKELTLPGAEGTVAKITASPSEFELLADGISTVNFTITLAGTEGEPINNQTVYCSTDAGTIKPTTLTGDPSNPDSTPGVAYVNYTSLASHEDRDAEVIFKAGDLEKSVTLKLKGITLISTADPSILPSDGQSKSVVTVLVKETTTNIPITRQEVRFGATDGIIGATSVTDDNGVATSTYTSGYESGTTDIYVNFGKTLVDTVKVNISEVTARGIELFANPTQIAANGISQSTVTALLRDDNFNPVIGEVIRFTTTLGTITAADSTDEFGRAEAILESERRNGAALVTATFKEHVKEIPVNFTGVNISVSSSPENLFAGGDEETEITAYLKDAAEVPIVGEEIIFTWYLEDEFKEEIKATTDVQGRASIKLNSSESGEAKIVVSGSGAADSTSVTFTRIQFTIDSEQQTISTGGDTLDVWVQLYDTVNDKYISNAEVNFFATIGDITSSATTDSDGKASAQLISGATAGTVTVSAAATIDGSRVSSNKEFTFVNADPGAVSLNVDANIVAIGGNNSALIAVVTDSYGNPVSDTLVSFKILEGPAGGEYIRPATVTTGTSGTATTYFYSGQIPSDFEGVKLQASVGSIKSNDATLTIAGAPETIQPSFNADWTTESINNENGTYTLPISATVLDINSNGVVDGTTVYFKIDPPEGAVLSPVKTENSVAVSTITYPSASAGREVTLTASAGGKEGAITFSLPGFVVSYMSLTAQPKTILADGKSTTTIKATLFDKNGSSVNVPDGTTVSFTTDGGSLDPIVAKTEKGVATTTLTSDKSARYVFVEGQSGLFQSGTYVYFEEIGSTINSVNDIVLKIYDDDGNENPTIEADGISNVTVEAQLLKFDGEPVTTPTTVEFGSNIGQITNFVRSDENGKAYASFSSGEVGTATITATVGNNIGYGSIVVSPGPPRSIELSFSPSFVNVKGAGMNETLIVTANVMDSKDNPVGDGNLVMFELVGSYDTDAALSPTEGSQYESIPVPTLNGAATVSFHAGSKAGPVRVRAYIVNESGNATSPLVESETTQFMVFGGPPYLDTTDASDPFTESRVKIYTSPINILANKIGEDFTKATVTVAVADRYNNPVPAGTAVYFTTTGGYITNSTGYTDENGLAAVTLYTGNPFPTLTNSRTIDNPNYGIVSGSPRSFTVPTWDFDGNGQANDGVAVITARTEGVDQDGDNVTVWNYAQVIFSLAVTNFSVSANDYSLDLGEVAQITIDISDVNGNPVLANSTIAVTSTEGELSSKSFTTADPGKTQFITSLTNNLDPLTDSPSNAIVTVKLTSENGNHSVDIIQPIYLTINAAQ